MSTLAIQIGFLEIGFLDLIDVLLVSILLYQLYRLLRGSLALNIFIGFLIIFLTWYIVKALDMKLLTGILGQIFGVGAIALIVVFQPELRRILLFIGRGNIIYRSRFLRRLFQSGGGEKLTRMEDIDELVKALAYLSEQRMGAIFVFPRTSRMQLIAETGVLINGRISAKLLQSIFFKNNPLHDGAVIVVGGRIQAAGCILPVSDKVEFGRNVGLRHRAALGITEQSDAYVIVVSEQTGELAMADEGKLSFDLKVEFLERKLRYELTEST